MARLSIEHLRKVYGEFTAVDDCSIDIAEGEFLEAYVVEIEPNVTVEIVSTYNARD